MIVISSKDLSDDFFHYQDMKVSAHVKEIIETVRKEGDRAVLAYTRQFDGVDVKEILLQEQQLKNACQQIDRKTIQAIEEAANNIRTFAEIQKHQFQDFQVELSPGVKTGQRVIPIQRVGVYVPGGSFPLVSSLLMGAIPAIAVGVEEIIVCSPPTYRQSVAPAILAAAEIVGLKEVCQIGGVQAIAAMAYGTESIRAVDKIVGPGNKYVAQAKQEVFGVVGIDLLAGPTEVLIIADDEADPAILAADLLAQAEHDIDASPLLITLSKSLVSKVIDCVEQQLQNLSTRETAQVAWEKNGMIIVVENVTEAIHIANRKAPEHLEIQVKEPAQYLPFLKNYGSLFVGELTAEVLGDYSSGLNHTLPTNRSARYRGGLSVQDFLKFQTTLEVNENGFSTISPIAKILAGTEGLEGHRKSLEIRQKCLKDRSL